MILLVSLISEWIDAVNDISLDCCWSPKKMLEWWLSARLWDNCFKCTTLNLHYDLTQINCYYYSEEARKTETQKAYHACPNLISRVNTVSKFKFKSFRFQNQVSQCVRGRLGVTGDWSWEIQPLSFMSESLFHSTGPWHSLLPLLSREQRSESVWRVRLSWLWCFSIRLILWNCSPIRFVHLNKSFVSFLHI